MQFLGTCNQDHRLESHRALQDSTRLRLMAERRTSSPRAAVAFSALSALSWIAEKSGWLVTRVLPRRTGHQKLAVGTQNIPLERSGN